MQKEETVLYNPEIPEKGKEIRQTSLRFWFEKYQEVKKANRTMIGFE